MNDEAKLSEGRLRLVNPDALAAVFEHYRPRLRQVVRVRMDTRLAARIDPSDVVQDSFFDAARRIDSYCANPGVSAFVWLRGLAMDRLLKLQRRHLGTQRRSMRRELRLPADRSAVLMGQLLAKGPSPSQAALREELRDRIQRAILRLRPSDRELILMRHFEGMSNAEVAETLNIKESTATMRHGRALHRLRELMADLAPGDSRS